MSKAEKDTLGKLIQKGDIVLLASGNCHTVLIAPSLRVGMCYYQWWLNCRADTFGIPVMIEAVQEVWRDGNLLYKRGETPIQRSMF